MLSPVECLACLSLWTMCVSVWVEKEIFPEEDVRFKPRLFYVRGDGDFVLQTHQHDVVYYGVVILIDNNYVLGAVDVWRCLGCIHIYCVEKCDVMNVLVPVVGMTMIDLNYNWP